MGRTTNMQGISPPRHSRCSRATGLLVQLYLARAGT